MPKKDSRNPVARAAYLRARKADRIARGLCLDCPEKVTDSRRLCEECRRCRRIKRSKTPVTVTA